MYETELHVAQNLAHIAAARILPIYHGEMETMIKKDGTPVTNADVLANHIIVDGLQQAFPNDGIVSEELGNIDGARTWYIDPIDGTRGFINHTDDFAIHIGLAVDQQPVVGVVYKPATGEMYKASQGNGAFRVSPTGLEKRIQVAQSDSLIMMVSKRAGTYADFQPVREALQPTKYVATGSEGIRIALLASGQADLHYQWCSTWDSAAPIAIANEAGAKASFLDGSPILYHGQRQHKDTYVVASSQELLEMGRQTLLDVFTQYQLHGK